MGSFEEGFLAQTNYASALRWCNALLAQVPTNPQTLDEPPDFRYQLNLIATTSPRAVEVGTPLSVFPNARFHA